MNNITMEGFDRKKHWENIYQTKELKSVSWYQAMPETSLAFVKELNLPLSAKIIDVGGGDSLLVDYLLELGYEDITVLDISEKALERAKLRLGPLSSKVKWIVSDITTFKATEKYAFWHDRAVFHFFTHEQEVEKYVLIVNESLESDGFAVVGTFSEDGPTSCSGLEVKQYSEKTLTDSFHPFFDKIVCKKVNHPTPFATIQNFVFCIFRKKIVF